MTKFEQVTLRVRDPDRQAAFYRNVLKMDDLGLHRVGYANDQAHLYFEKTPSPYLPARDDLYWKIALSVPNIELACAQLRASGVACSEPQQFFDVGYLAHFTDPEGFQIELIDHAFKGERSENASHPDLLGGGAHFNLVTLRTADIAQIEPTLLQWGMRKLSVQPLNDFGFTLHFYAFTEDMPPNSDLSAVENRTWVYQRPYTVLELQHVHNLSAVRMPSEGQAGLKELVFSAKTHLPALEALRITWADETVSA